MSYRIAVLALGLVALLGCSFNVTVTRGSGNIVTEARAVSNFTRVVLAGIGELNITQGDTESLTIEADDNLIPLITTQVQNDTLTIGFDTRQVNISINPTRPIRYTLVVKNLNSLQLSGAGNINAPALKSDSLVLGNSGAGNLNLAQVEAKTLNTTISGAGSVNVAGQVESQDISVTGLGSYNAADLKSNAASVTLSGAGSATVWATQTLNVTISGAGSVNYYGSPQVSQTITGLGSVKNVGNK